VKALLADDHVLFAEAVRPTLERMGFEVRVVAAGDDAVAAIAEDACDIVFLDIGLPGESGLVVGRRILERSPESRVVALTALADAESVGRALTLGFRAYLSKDMPVARFVSSVRAVMDGDLIFPGRHARVAETERRHDESAHLLARQLTIREREVLTMLVEAQTGGEIARRLGISRNTVRTHIQSILSKLQVHSRLEAAAFAVRHRLVQPEARR
jgi:two-component system, NarL family, nitrate/nitrite response regulator NarL